MHKITSSPVFNVIGRSVRVIPRFCAMCRTGRFEARWVKHGREGQRRRSMEKHVSWHLDLPQVWAIHFGGNFISSSSIRTSENGGWVESE